MKRRKKDEDRPSVFLRPRESDKARWEAAAEEDDTSVNAWVIQVVNAEVARRERKALANQPTLAELMTTLADTGQSAVAQADLLIVADRVIPEGRLVTRRLLPQEVTALRHGWIERGQLRKEANSKEEHGKDHDHAE